VIEVKKMFKAFETCQSYPITFAPSSLGIPENFCMQSEKTHPAFCSIQCCFVSDPQPETLDIIAGCNVRNVQFYSKIPAPAVE
jgi:hypothetical protein